VLDDGELGEDLGVKHLDHALVDLAPAVADSRDVEENGAVLPEGAFLDVVDEGYRREVHPGVAVVFGDLGLSGVAGTRCVRC